MAAAIFLGGNAFFGRLWAGGVERAMWGRTEAGERSLKGFQGKQASRCERSGEMKEIDAERIGLWREAAAFRFG